MGHINETTHLNTTRHVLAECTGYQHQSSIDLNSLFTKVLFKDIHKSMCLMYLGVSTHTIPMWQKYTHSLSFRFSQEQRLSRRRVCGVAFTDGLLFAWDPGTDRYKEKNFKQQVTKGTRTRQCYKRLWFPRNIYLCLSISVLFIKES